MTTVGYGDPSPHTTAVKIIAVIVMLVGIGFVALLTGALARTFVRPTAFWGGKPADIAATEEDLLVQVRDLSAQIRQLESALETRLGSRQPHSQ
jgi:hypothetical protein